MLSGDASSAAVEDMDSFIVESRAWFPLWGQLVQPGCQPAAGCPPAPNRSDGRLFTDADPPLAGGASGCLQPATAGAEPGAQPASRRDRDLSNSIRAQRYGCGAWSSANMLSAASTPRQASAADAAARAPSAASASALSRERL